MATSILNTGTRRPTQAAQPQVQEGWFQRLGRKLGVVPQASVQKVVNRRDLYQASLSYDQRVVKGVANLTAGKLTPKSAIVPKNALDHALLPFLADVIKNGINV